jgi:hypothetical protein
VVKTVTAAHCLRCDWVPAGDPDRDAERHTKKTGHPTATVTEPVR